MPGELIQATTTNQPKLAEADPPWDFENEPGWVEKLRALPAAIQYWRKFGPYTAPTSLDVWAYRSKLKDLDPACLKTLKAHGALSASELAEWLNRDDLLRMRPEKTGIRHVTVDTVCDWVELARRRNLVTGLPPAVESAGETVTHWVLSEQGREAIRSPLGKLAARMPQNSGTAVVGVGGFLVGWLAKNQLALIVAAVLAAMVLYAALLMLATMHSERRDRPGVAVVAIETVRSAGKPIPSLSPTPA